MLSEKFHCLKNEIEVIIRCIPPVAQLVEHVSYTHAVPGSSPGGWTKNYDAI